MESLKTSLQAIEPNPSCLGLTHSNKPGSGHGYESVESGYIFTVLSVPSINSNLYNNLYSNVIVSTLVILPNAYKSILTQTH